jgi:hypothetical protein
MTDSLPRLIWEPAQTAGSLEDKHDHDGSAASRRGLGHEIGKVRAHPFAGLVSALCQ